ncbi:MAG: O-antigen ligase family protein [Clostridiales bacterium]|nr:O-antigen ligase family protein [Clostridiales bacterium]
MSTTETYNLKYMLNSKSAFRICCLFSAFFQLITYLDYVFYAVTFVVFIWGIYLTAKSIFINGAFKKAKYSSLILAMIVLSGATVIANITSPLLSTLITVSTAIINIVYLFLFFCDIKSDVNIIRKEIYIISKGLVYITSACAVVGLILLIVFHRAVWIGDRSLIIYENRFKGLYINPNPMAFASVTGILSCLILRCRGFLLKTGKKPIRIRWFLLAFGLNGLALMLSVSNSGILLLSCFIFGILCYILFAGNSFKSFFTIVKKTLLFLICCAVALFGLLTVRAGVNFSSGVLLSGEPIVSRELLAPTTEQYNSELQTDDGLITFEHINTTFDSGRLKLYSKAVTSISETPVFGVGYGNILYNGFIKTGKLFDYHNGYLTLAASNGIVFFAVFVIFGLLLAKRMTTVVFKLKLQSSKSVLPFLMCFIYGYCVYACVEPTMMFYPSYQVMFFWWILGCAFALVKDFEKDFKNQLSFKDLKE